MSVYSFVDYRVSEEKLAVSILRDPVKVTWPFFCMHFRILSLGFTVVSQTIVCHGEDFFLIMLTGNSVCFLYLNVLIFVHIREIFCFYVIE